MQYSIWSCPDFLRRKGVPQCWQVRVRSWRLRSISQSRQRVPVQRRPQSMQKRLYVPVLYIALHSLQTMAVGSWLPDDHWRGRPHTVQGAGFLGITRYQLF